jgi:flagellar protein FlaJ
MAKLDASKFMIQNLGNLIFGTGVILPFSGMLLSSMMGNQGFPGIINAIDLVLTKIGPMLALVFGIFVKFRVE